MANTNVAILKIYTEDIPYDLVVSDQFVKSAAIFPDTWISNVIVVDLI